MVGQQWAKAGSHSMPSSLQFIILSIAFETMQLMDVHLIHSILGEY